MFNVELSGFDELQKQLRDAQKALQALDGDLCSLRFDPSNPADVQRAIEEMEGIVDARISPYRNNPLVAPVVDAAKKSFREEILRRAQEARGQV